MEARIFELNQLWQSYPDSHKKAVYKMTTEDVARVFQDLPTQSELQLTYTHSNASGRIGFVTTIFLAKLIHHSSYAIKCLNLSGNIIQEYGAAWLAEGIQHPNNTLEVLNLHNNSLYDKGAHEIATAIKSRYWNIHTLNLSANLMTDYAIDPIISAINSNPRCPLVEVDVASPFINPQKRQDLDHALIPARERLLYNLFQLAAASVMHGTPRDITAMILRCAAPNIVSNERLSKIVTNAQQWQRKGKFQFFDYANAPAWYAKVLRTAINTCLPLHAQARLLSDMISFAQFLGAKLTANAAQTKEENPRVEILDEENTVASEKEGVESLPQTRMST